MRTAAIFCDCGKEKVLKDDEFVEMGVSKHIYCKGKCEERVLKYLKARDSLHDDCVKVWDEGIAKLRSDKFSMPDQYESV